MRRDRTVVLVSMCMLAGSLAMAEDPSHAPQAPHELRQMLRITWSRGPDLPQGVQDNDGGVIGDTLIAVGGFCSGLEADNRRKPGRYPRGFLDQTWGLDLSHPQGRWEMLPRFPGAARQGLFSALVDQTLYYWGGFSYAEPFCYSDGWALARGADGQWKWSELTQLPWKLTSAAACVIGARIYMIGGADYDGKIGFYTEADRDGQHERLGARVLVFDTTDRKKGWTRLADLPGTPRFVHTVQAVGQKVYVIGGATGGTPTRTVVDNWEFSPETNQWRRIRDLPISSGNFSRGNLVVDSRYILLIGGYQYGEIANPDGTSRPNYGKPSARSPLSGLCNDLFVYDVRRDEFGTADKLPIDNNLPMALVHKDELMLIGGETGGGMVEGEFYGHHPDLFLRGRIEVVP
jgi:N-acetylneuraminate epimerase